MSGILFLRTADLSGITRFYVDTVGMDLWLEQKDVTILRHGNFIVGFVAGPDPETEGLLTFFYPDREGVDRAYEIPAIKETARGEPRDNPTYNIYNFFAADPEGRPLEFQTFLHDVEPYLASDELIVGRRSIRQFQDRDVSDDVMEKVMDLCRWSPTSMNSQSYHFTATRDPVIRKTFSEIRGGSSAPLGRAPVAVAIHADPGKSRGFRQDADIAAYHFMLSAHCHGLGTCWIADMDRDIVKDALGIPRDHYVSTVTPLGYPAEKPEPKGRRPGPDLWTWF